MRAPDTLPRRRPSSRVPRASPRRLAETVAVDHVSFDVKLRRDPCASRRERGRQVDPDPHAGRRPCAGFGSRFLVAGQAGQIFRIRAKPSSMGSGSCIRFPMFVPNLSITENLLLGVPFTRKRAGLIDWQAEHLAARGDLAAVGLSVDPRADLETLSAHERQLVAVARALKRGLKALVLDEVTASLSEPEVRILHSHIRSCAPDGVSIIYVSHRLRGDFSHRRPGHGLARRQGSRDAERLRAHEKRWRGISSATKWAICSSGEQYVRVVGKAAAGGRWLIRRTAAKRFLQREARRSAGRLRTCRFRTHATSAHDLRAHAAYVRDDHQSTDERYEFRDPAEALAAGVTMVTEDRIEGRLCPDASRLAKRYVAVGPIFSALGIPSASRGEGNRRAQHQPARRTDAEASKRT